MTCIFCNIRDGKAPAHVVWEDETTIAFLDYRPLAPGHTLVVLKEHAETLPEAPRSALGPLFEIVQRVSDAAEIALGADGSLVAVNNRVSQSVPHLHVHVVPRRHGDWALPVRLLTRWLLPSVANASEVAGKIRDHLNRSRAGQSASRTIPD